MYIVVWITRLPLIYLQHVSTHPGRYLEYQCSKSGSIIDFKYDINCAA
jgi:hypothetical protein